MKRPPLFRATFDASELVVDNFAGGGGASSGIEAALGRPPDIAINHDAEAIAMHKANHPHTKHYIENIWKVDPKEACGGRPVGLAWFSPDCKHFSRSKGGKPRDKKIRGLAWTVVRWAQAVRPRIIFLENVEEFKTWGPLDRKGYPIPEKSGQTFRAWLRKLERLGYAVEYQLLRAADYGTPTTRRRLFLIARCDGVPIAWPEPTHGKGRARAWRPAAEIIDWSLPCPSIFDRKKPLAEATMRRIAAGLKRYVIESPDPFILPLTHQGDARVYRLNEPLRTVTGAHRGEFALCGPTLITASWGERKGQAPRVPGLEKPLGAVVAGGIKHRLVAPVITKHFGGLNGHQTPGQSLKAPLGTVTARDHNTLTAAWITKYYGTAQAGTDARAPLPTVLSGGNRGGGHLAEVRAFMVKFYGQGGHPATQDLFSPLHTVTAKARFGLVTIHGVDYQIVDIGMRMLAPHELFLAQGFAKSYKINIRHQKKKLSKGAQIRLAGNAVCPQLAEALVKSNVTRRAA